MKNIREITTRLLLAIFVLSSVSCDKFLTENPTSDLTDREVLESVTGLGILLKGTYRMMRDGNNNPPISSPSGIKILSTVTGTDMMVNQEQVGNNWNFYTYNNQRYDPAGAVTSVIWGTAYKVILNTNIIIGNIDQAAGVQSEKDAIKGQALALRARNYFNLVRLYQHTYSVAKGKLGVPLQLKEDLEPKERATVEEVYKRILQDLGDAEHLLKNYDRSNNRNYYNIDVVNFLLAQVYLTMENWEQAEKYAREIRTTYSLMSMTEYGAGFSSLNKEWVLGYEQGAQDYWWYDSPACWFDFGQNNAPWQSEQILPSNYFVEVVMKDDPRLLVIPNPLYPTKYAATKFRELKSQPPYGHLYDLRAAEMYLVEAEAAARQGKVTEALQVLNLVQSERDASITTTTAQEMLIEAILLERRKEMWGEGIEWFDMLRLKTGVEKTLAQGHYQELSIPALSNKLIMMIPEKEVVNNRLLVQNPHPGQEPVFKP
ncbi:RagB/SusD family nutrient uptake outer membrane protein [Sphingobacterium tabacisoli]|uniref:RagB/SusD family nutrient uptake outer membrane protein n=1 Tax=Sphingobacterium tabacisoli TaxID=2044855 RepID=A0ABW5L780_9SPHI|nr:RagB/SusD family nutrient uptake outer membrane protein [Sphingobacterium tabacisoli]